MLRYVIETRRATRLLLLCCAAALACPLLPALAQDAAQTAAETPAPPSGDAAKRLLESRAVEAAIWGIPAVNYDLMLQEMLTKTPGKVGQVIYWSTPLDWHNQTLTPNPDALYFMTFVNLKDGPVVLEIPPGDAEASLNANIVTLWQMPLEDAGLLGADRGKGGKYLLLPPGYTGPKPEGFSALQSDTFGAYALIRSNLRSHSDADVARSAAYGSTVRVYPLAQAANPPATVFTDVRDIEFDSTIKYDATFFEHLDHIIQNENWIDRDRAMIDQLKTIGIEKGKPFAPNASTKAALAAAAQEAHAYLEAKYNTGGEPFFSATSRWIFPLPSEVVKQFQTGYGVPNLYSVDDRGMMYSFAFIALKRLGAAQYYLISLRDKDGDALDGGKSYHLRVPPKAPIEQYWSITAYDRETHALVRNMARASRSSQIADIQKNGDGSIDLYFGPTAPAGKETNWVPTDPARKFELMFRAYGPTKAFFDKKWTLPDPEKAVAR